MRKFIRANVLNMAQSEILSLIPQDTLDRIKKTDQSPQFRVYVVGHEGTAQAQELSFGQKVSKAFHYMKDVIVGLADKLVFGTPIFQDHGSTNSHAGREQIGEVVGKAVRNVAGKISALAAIYLYPQHREKNLDVASIEADIVYEPKGDREADVLEVSEVSGIAVSSSDIAKPAFPGATLLGVVQAFTKQGEGQHMKMTIEELKAAIKEAGAKITDIFAADEIVSSEPAQKAKQTDHEHARRLEKQLGEEREKIRDLTKSVEDANGKIKTLNEKVSTSTVRSIFDTSATKRKLSDKEKAFIEKNVGSFKSDKEGADLEQDFERFMDAQVKAYEETAKLFGIDPKAAGAGSGSNNQGASGAGAGSTDGSAGGENLTEEEKMRDPKYNDLIPA